jgi:hypothetical protein
MIGACETGRHGVCVAKKAALSRGIFEGNYRIGKNITGDEYVFIQ